MHVSLLLPHSVRSISAARRALDEAAADVDAQTLRNARLLVSELVTNAIRHAEGDVELVVDGGHGRLRVEVTDHGPGFTPAPRAARQDLSSGWGLHILAHTASRWGVESDGGTRVWFELDTDRSAPPGAAAG